MSVAIDAHQHFWSPVRGDYHWMPENDPVAGPILARPHLPSDLEPSLQRCGIRKTVLVQAAATVVETEYMLGIADATESVAAVVGWVDFEDPSEIDTLKRLARHPKFRGVRPMIQDIPDVNWMLRDDVQWAFRAVCDLDLTFDALGFPQHLENFGILFARYPSMRTVIDHCMKPQIGAAREDPASMRAWADGMARLAAETGAYCKLSGLVTEAAEDWAEADLAPAAAHALRSFGPERIMWGSDWPVCRLRASYEEWHRSARSLTASVDDAGRARIFGGTAAEFYRIA